MDKLFILDASGYLYASYHAIQNMTNSRGESTNALFGFINSVEKVLKTFSPSHIAIVYDGEDNIRRRKELYEQYKATRSKAPPDFYHQVEWSKKYCDLRGLKRYEEKGFEADDVMATLAVWGAEQGAQVFICSSDKDMCQLVNDKILIVNVRKDNEIVDSNAIVAKYGIPPSQIRDWLAIVGDTSDNVPGIPGFGPKTATQLLQQMGTLQNILDTPSAAGGPKKQQAIEENRTQALLSQQLVTVDVAVPMRIEEPDLAIATPSTDELRSFFRSNDFNSFLKALEGGSPPVKKTVPCNYHTVDSVEALNDLIALLRNHKEICLDTETTDIDPMKATLVGIGLGVEPHQSYYIPLNGSLSPDAVRDALRPLLADPSHAFFGHNLKYDLHVLQRFGLSVTNVCFDTIIASYLLNAHARQHSLDALSLDLFGHKKIDTQELLGRGKNQRTMAEVPINEVSEYCCEDIDFTIRLKEALSHRLDDQHMQKLFYDLEMPLMRLLQKIEKNGIFLDIGILNTFAKELNSQIDEARSKVFAEAGCEFNINSPAQIGELFQKLGIKGGKKTKKGLPSTGAEELEKLKDKFPLAQHIQEYRILEKLRSTYVEALPQYINPNTGRIHGTFNQSIAATGRLSSQNPNLQNIPVRSAMGLRIREAFRPQQDGWIYLAADYSQIELRLLAHMSGDEKLVEAFLAGEDIHRRTASQIFQIPYDAVSDEMRYRAKAVNFGIIYGQQAFGLAQTLNIGVKEADSFIHMYFQRFPKIKEFLEGCKEQARQSGKAVTLWGRERSIPEINSPNGMLRQAAERLAVNTPFQGSAADLIKRAMLDIDSELSRRHLQALMILQIHDELIFELPQQEEETLRLVVQEKMEQVAKLRVPLVVNISVGNNWKQC